MAILATDAVVVRPRSVRRAEPSWAEDLRQAIRDPVELCRRLRLPAEYEAAAVRAAKLFPVFAPLPLVARMRLGDPFDPLLRQVLPLAEELDEQPGYVADPVGDDAATVVPGLLQKYAGRALLIVTGTCAVHCRYCFRRHFPYDESAGLGKRWETAVDYLARDDSIHEIILSGGDPLTVVDGRLANLAERLAEISHLRRLRVHTRLPIVIPRRVTDELLGWLRGTRLTPIVVIHANHPREIDADVAAALGRMVDAGVPVLNQAVLLRGVNDSADVLAELCERLVELRVMPYYLHQLDRVDGAAHFDVPVQRGRAIVRELQSRLPGYAVPRYVCETAGAAHKDSLL